MAKTVFDQKEALDLVVAYVPRKFAATYSASAKSFVALRGEQNGESKFQIDRILAAQNGVAELERMSIEVRVETEALDRLKSIQEEAYKAAYQLGLDEGRDRAHAEAKSDLTMRIDRLDQMLAALESLKTDLSAGNEAHFVKLAYYMAATLTVEEFAQKPELVIGVLRQAIMDAQSDERVVVRVSPEDKQIIEDARHTLARDAETSARIKIEASTSISRGGCVVETNYGSVDATIELRLKRLWEAVAEKLPKTSDVVGA